MFNYFKIKKMVTVVNQVTEGGNYYMGIPLEITAVTTNRIVEEKTNTEGKKYETLLPFCATGSFKTVTQNEVEIERTIDCKKISICLNSVCLVAKKSGKKPIDVLNEVFKVIKMQIETNQFPNWIH